MPAHLTAPESKIAGQQWQQNPLRLTAEPAAWRVVRWARGMPQYTLGHRERLARIGQRLEGLPGLLLAGASYRGVGLPDCIASGWAAAEQALGVVRSAAA